jgi:hypothetical protein
VVLTKKEIKKRYFDKVYESAPMISCACGCGELVKSKDHYGRDRQFINGHNGRKYDDPTEYKRAWNHRNRDQRQSYKRRRTHQLKAQLIMDMGGKCGLCGLDFDGECSAIFDFHHRDPMAKMFSLNNASLTKYSIQNIRDEMEKCDLLCANCHRLLHWNWKTVNTADPQEDLKNPVTEEKV